MGAATLRCRAAYSLGKTVSSSPARRRSARLAPEPSRAPRIVRSPTPPHAPDDPEHLGRQLHDRLEPREPIAVALCLESGEPGPPRYGPRQPHRRVVEGPAEERPATLRDPRLPGELPGLDPHDVQARELPELAEPGLPGDVPNLGEEDRGEGRPHPREAQEQPIRRERGRDGDEFGLNPRDARLHADQAGCEVGQFVMEDVFD